MSMIDPTKIKFESQSDVIDYVTKGLPPKKKDFEALMSAIEDRSTAPTTEENNNPNHVVIAPGVEFDMDDDALSNALHQIYGNRRHNRNILIGAAVVVGALVFMGGSHQHSRIKELESENEKMAHIIEDDMPVVNISSM